MHGSDVVSCPDPPTKKSLLFYYSSVVFKGNTTITNNLPYTIQLTTMSSEGGGITAFQSTVDFEGIVNLKRNSATNGGAISSVSSKLNVRGNLSLLQNIATDSGGGIYLYQSVLICKGMSILTLLGNNATDRGGGIHAIGSTITLQYSLYFKTYLHSVHSGSKLLMISNVAMNFGGGICFENNAKFKVFNEIGPSHESTHAVTFCGNTATYGGALYVADDTTSGTCSASNSHSSVTECFFQTSNVENVATVNDLTMESPVKLIHTEFANNHALVHGSNLFGGLLDRCTQSPFSDN